MSGTTHTHYDDVHPPPHISNCLIDLVIREEGLMDDLGDALGFNDVDFQGRKEFSERFHVEGTDR